MKEQYKWMIHHAYNSNSKNKRPYLKYWMDRSDLHPKTTIKLNLAKLYSFISSKPVAIFIHIPKTGGSYLNLSFPKFSFVSMGHVLIRKALNDEYIPVGLIGTKIKIPKNFFVFSTVRNPLTFFRSYYHHVIGHGPWHNPNHYDFNAGKKGFDYLMKTIMNRTDKWPSRKFLFPQLFDQDGNLIVNWINKNESLDRDMITLCENLGYQFKKGERQRVSPAKSLSRYFIPHLLEEAYKIYHREFKLFGYCDSSKKCNIPILHGDTKSADIKYYYKKDKLEINGHRL
jgi:hypothetical protein